MDGRMDGVAFPLLPPKAVVHWSCNYQRNFQFCNSKHHLWPQWARAELLCLWAERCWYIQLKRRSQDSNSEADILTPLLWLFPGMTPRSLKSPSSWAIPYNLQNPCPPESPFFSWSCQQSLSEICQVPWVCENTSERISHAGCCWEDC